LPWVCTWLIVGLFPGWSWLTIGICCFSIIYNYLCNQCLSPLMRGVLDTTLCDKVCQWLVTGWGFFLVHCCTPVSTINKTACHNITEMLLKVALITITLTHPLNHLSQKYHNIINQWKTWTWLDNLISNSNTDINKTILKNLHRFTSTRKGFPI
jgi:hypothetical protein